MNVNEDDIRPGEVLNKMYEYWHFNSYDRRKAERNI